MNAINYIMDYGNIEETDTEIIIGGEITSNSIPNGGFPPLILVDELKNNNIFESIILKSKKYKNKSYYSVPNVIKLEDIRKRLRQQK